MLEFPEKSSFSDNECEPRWTDSWTSAPSVAAGADFRAPPMTLSAGTRLGMFEILGPLGAGGMGEVYRARDVRLGREVAIKVLPAEFSADPGA